jgi:hypothetical protein
MATLNPTSEQLVTLRTAQLRQTVDSLEHMTEELAEMRDELGVDPDKDGRRASDMASHIATIRADLDALELLFREQDYGRAQWTAGDTVGRA